MDFSNWVFAFVKNKINNKVCFYLKYTCIEVLIECSFAVLGGMLRLPLIRVLSQNLQLHLDNEIGEKL